MTSLLSSLLIGGAAVLSSPQGSAAGPSAAGHWTGAIQRDGALLPISVTIGRETGEGGEASGLSGAFDLPTWGVYAQPTPVAAGEGGLEIGLFRGSMQLQLDGPGGALHGEVVGLGVPSTVTVELTRAVAPALPAIVVEDVEFESADGVSLAGTLFLPAEGARLPGLVLVQGRSYGPREQFRSHGVLAARRGIAAVCFDGRGTGGSGGVRGAHTLANRLEDAEAALALLRSHPRVDAERVGMLGHSAGGWVAPVVAQRTGALAFVVLHSGPAAPLADQQGHVVRELAKLSGTDFTQEELEAAYHYQRELAEMTIAGAEWSEIEAHVLWARSERWSAHVDLPDGPDDSELDYYRRNPHDSRDALRALKVPVLALFGEQDFVVPPDLNVPLLEELLAEAGNEDHRVVVFPGANHDLYLDAVEEEGEPYRWMRRPPGYFETIFGWIGERVR